MEKNKKSEHTKKKGNPPKMKRKERKENYPGYGYRKKKKKCEKETDESPRIFEIITCCKGSFVHDNEMENTD